MSKVTKIVLITAGSLMALGIVLSIIGFVVMRKSVKAATTESQYEYKEEYVEEAFKDLDLSEVSHNIVFRPSEDGKVKITYFDKDNYNHKIEVSNDTLRLTVKTYDDNSPWWSRFTWHIDLDGIGSTTQDYTTTIYLPEDSYGSLKINTVSGDVKIPEKYAFDGVGFSTTSGDVEALCTMTGKVESNTTSGEISLSNLKASELDINTISGSIAVLDSDVTGKSSISVTSGDITISKLKTSDLEVNSVSGDVKLEDLDTNTAEIDTTSGEITGNIIGDHEYDIDTVSGDIDIPSNVKGQGLIEVNSVSGDIRLK